MKRIEYYNGLPFAVVIEDYTVKSESVVVLDWTKCGGAGRRPPTTAELQLIARLRVVDAPRAVTEE